MKNAYPTGRFADVLVGAVKSPDENTINALHSRAEELLMAFQRKLTKLSDAMKAGVTQYQSEANAITANATGQDKQILAQAAKRTEANRILGLRRNLEQSSQSERDAVLTQLAEVAKQAKMLDSLFVNTVFMLAYYGLGTAEKAMYLEELEDLGPVAIEQYARLALLTNNKFLASAIINVIESSGAKRGNYFHPQELSEALLGDEFKLLKNKLAAIQQAFIIASAANREFVTGRGDPFKGLSLGLAQAAIDRANIQTKSALESSKLQDANQDIRAINNRNNTMTLPDGTVLGDNTIKWTEQTKHKLADPNHKSLDNPNSLSRIKAGIADYTQNKSGIHEPVSTVRAPK